MLSRQQLGQVKAMSATDVVRASFQAYVTQDREAMERLLADDYVLTSPQDDHIGKADFLKKCFPTADRFVTQDIVELAPADDAGIFVMYEYQLKNGERYRNVEFSTTRSGQLAETRVFFGGRV